MHSDGHRLALSESAAVGDFVGQRVLERVLQLGEETGLVTSGGDEVAIAASGADALGPGGVGTRSAPASFSLHRRTTAIFASLVNPPDHPRLCL
jgi:hypothetical protein